MAARKARHKSRHARIVHRGTGIAPAQIARRAQMRANNHLNAAVKPNAAKALAYETAYGAPST